MSSSTVHPHKNAAVRRRRQRRRNRWIAAGVTTLAIVILVVVGRSVVERSTNETASPTDAATAAPVGHDMNAALPPGYELTGAVGPMGGKVLKTPGTRSGDAAAGGVVVTDGADIVMGHIPLAFAVDPTWHLQNTSDHAVTLGQPKVTVVKGCCPAEPILGTTTLAPGADTTLQFPTQMHPGMDGDHLFRLAVPVSGSGEPLVVSVAGDFS